MHRRALQLLIALALFTVPLVAPMAPAHADDSSTLLGLVNVLRAANGVRPLSADPALTNAAHRWSAHMTTAGLVHNPSLASEIGGGWTKLGENIGEGGTVAIVFNAFVNSAFHFRNMVDPLYNLTGIGVVAGSNGTLWITQDFEGKPGATPSTPAPTTTRPPSPVTTTTAAPTRPTAAPTTSTTAPITSTTAPATTVTTDVTPESTTVLGATPGDATPGGPTAGGTTAPARLAIAASLSAQHRSNSGIWWIVTLTAAAIAALGGGVALARSGGRQNL